MQEQKFSLKKLKLFYNSPFVYYKKEEKKKRNIFKSIKKTNKLLKKYIVVTHCNWKNINFV